MINTYLVCFVVSTFTTMYVAWLGDNYKSKYGRRKPFVIFGYVVKAVAFMALMAPPSKDGSFLIVWFMVFYNMFIFGAACGDGPISTLVNFIFK